MSVSRMARTRRSPQAGSVYHVAHPTSCTEGVKPHHGEQATFENLPYTNPASWGLAGFPETEIAPRVWRLG